MIHSFRKSKDMRKYSKYSMMYISLIIPYFVFGEIDQKGMGSLDVVAKNDHTFLKRKEILTNILSITAGGSIAAWSGYCIFRAKTGAVPRHLIIPLAIFSLFYSNDIIGDGVKNLKKIF